VENLRLMWRPNTAATIRSQKLGALVFVRIRGAKAFQYTITWGTFVKQLSTFYIVPQMRKHLKRQ
jgi:hypothetical protein